MSTASVDSPLLSPGMPGTATQTATNDSQSPAAATGTTPATMPRPLKTNVTPISPGLPRKADTAMSWGAPAGLGIRKDNDENLLIFRQALGINTHQHGGTVADGVACHGGSLEEGRKAAVGVYRMVIETQARMRWQHAALQAFLYVVYFVQIVIGAGLTALGASASAGSGGVVTALGALNTVLAGVLALIKGSGQPQKLGKDRVGFRRLQDWIEETEALLAVGVVGRDRREVGLLVESAFKRYNAAKASEEDNDPDFYVYGRQEPLGYRAGEDGNGRDSYK
ncbi:putative c6 transcription protein [Rosellinia necatrix]|uniref:Putative c6 transcription protein n=1 Tax=Rosellinia necatrix TaxID=77044 RepID=A0A1S7UK89_ROSNE|nr:putative c6 transcription protein [Rosellinia necatrix]